LAEQPYEGYRSSTTAHEDGAGEEIMSRAVIAPRGARSGEGEDSGCL